MSIQEFKNKLLRFRYHSNDLEIVIKHDSVSLVFRRTQNNNSQTISDIQKTFYFDDEIVKSDLGQLYPSGMKVFTGNNFTIDSGFDSYTGELYINYRDNTIEDSIPKGYTIPKKYKVSFPKGSPEYEFFNIFARKLHSETENIYTERHL